LFPLLLLLSLLSTPASHLPFFSYYHHHHHHYYYDLFFLSCCSLSLAAPWLRL
jgi:hypothetical protein